MANYSVAQAKHTTLSTTVADVVTITGMVPVLQIVNSHATNSLYVKVGSVDPGAFAAAADDALVVPPMDKLVQYVGRQGMVVRLIGNSNPYSVQAVSPDHR